MGMKIAIVGAAGRMGQKLIELAKGTDLEVVSKVDVAEGFDRTWSDDVEGVIDFSYHTGVPAAITKAAEQGIAYVIGTTGLTAEEQKAVDAAATKIPVVQSGNYSLGVNLLLELVQKAATVLGPEYDIEVTEMHHRHKKDAPSGTALMLARAAHAGRKSSCAATPATEAECFVFGRQGDIGERPQGEIAIHALRWLGRRRPYGDVRRRSRARRDHAQGAGPRGVRGGGAQGSLLGEGPAVGHLHDAPRSGLRLTERNFDIILLLCP